MISSETERILINLEKIEAGLSRIYGRLSRKAHFTGPVRRFWAELMEEELAHATVFRDLLKKGREEVSVQIEAKTDRKQLERFVEKVNDLLQEVRKEGLSESEAYSIGALIEAELDEAHFIGTVAVNDEEMIRKIRRMENDTKRHRMILVNYSRGVK